MDRTAVPENCESIFILVPISSNGDDCDVYREEIFQYVVKRLEKYLGYDLKKFIDFKHLYGLRDFKNDYNSFKGNAYGSANKLDQFAFFRPRMKSSKVKNLYYTGQLTFPGGGLPPCLLSGRIISEIIDNNNWLKNIFYKITDIIVVILRKILKIFFF